MKQQTINKIIKLYKTGNSQSKIGKMLNYSQTTIYKILKEYKIKCRRPETWVRKHKINENFFEKWSSEMAYILGFIATDGGINKSTLSFHISKKDIEILNFIKNYLGETSIEHRPETNSVRIRFNSKKLIHSLEQYGIFPNKTFDLKINFKIPKQYVGDYIRGVFDGDGWVCHRPGKRKGLSFGICSASEQFIKDLHKLCNNIGIIRCRLYENDPTRSPQFYLENYTNEDAVKFRNIIYKNNTFSLRRKKNTFFSRLI